jgi:carboxymethylenebutenolidase
MERKKASDFDPEILKLFDRYVHGGISRREFLDAAARFAVGGLTAAAILESLGPNYAWAQQVPRDDKRIRTEYVTYPSPDGHGSIRAYVVRPADARGKLPGVVVVHENRGLNPYIEDVARRLGVAGFLSLAPDALTPARFPWDCLCRSPA